MYFEDYDSEQDSDYNEYNELTPEIISEFNYDKKIKIISFYKDKLNQEPEFIGIRNICSGKILNIIEETKKPEKPTKNDYKLNYEQYLIFVNMYSEVNLTCNNDIFNTVTNKIFNKIYVN